MYRKVALLLAKTRTLFNANPTLLRTMLCLSRKYGKIHLINEMLDYGLMKVQWTVPK